MVALVYATALLGCSGGSVAPDSPTPPQTTGSDSLIVIARANLIPMDRERVLHDYSIVIRAGRIDRIAPHAEIGNPSGARVIDARGRFVLPGLIDMHVHVNKTDLPDYVAHGITAVRNMWGYNGLGAIGEDVEAGRIVGPTIHSLSSGFDGSPVKWPATQLVDDLDQISPLIDAQVRAGYRELKVYADLSRTAYDSIVQVARQRGLTFAGHVPRRISVSYALEAGQRSIEHLTGYDLAISTAAAGTPIWASIDGSRIAPLAQATARAGVWNCPTLAIIDLMGNNSAVRTNRGRVVKALHDAGAKLLVGTDSGIGRTMPGASLAEELRLFVDAGLTPYQALRGATADAALYLNRSDIGTIKVDARADLVVLDANPLVDIAAVRKVRGVVLRGLWITN